MRVYFLLFAMACSTITFANVLTEWDIQKIYAVADNDTIDFDEGCLNYYDTEQALFAERRIDIFNNDSLFITSDGSKLMANIYIRCQNKMEWHYWETCIFEKNYQLPNGYNWRMTECAD